MQLLAAINGKLYALEEVDPNSVLDGCWEDCEGCDCPETDWKEFEKEMLDELDDESALGNLAQCLPDCDVMESWSGDVSDAVKKAFKDHKEKAVELINKQKDASRALEWCEPGMKIEVHPSDAAMYPATVIHGPNDITGSIFVQNDLSGMKHPVLASAKVFMRTDAEERPYGANPQSDQSQASSSAVPLEST